MPPPGYVTCQPLNATTELPDDIGKDDLNALLYIVVTLLFYSMGIIIGIITYLKREQADMEEDKMFDMYMQLKREPFNLHKKEQVNQMALYLKQLEEKQAAREKIENWKVVEPHQLPHHYQHSPSCRQQSNLATQPSPCPGCSKAFYLPETRRAVDGNSAPLARPENEWSDHRGGTALLCSLTLGVCEPLLTPDNGKRVAFPDCQSESPRVASGTRHVQSRSRDRRGETYKSAFRHSYPSVSYFNPGPVFTEGELLDKVFSNESELPLRSDDDDHHPDMFDKFDIELKDLRQFSHDEVKAVFQKEPSMQDENTAACDSSILEGVSSIPSRNKRTMSLSAPPNKNLRLTRQLSYDPERKSSGLAVHSLGLSSSLANTDSHRNSSSPENPTSEAILRLGDSRDSIACNEEPITGDSVQCDNIALDICDVLQERSLERHDPHLHETHQHGAEQAQQLLTKEPCDFFHHHPDQAEAYQQLPQLPVNSQTQLLQPIIASSLPNSVQPSQPATSQEEHQQQLNPDQQDLADQQLPPQTQPQQQQQHPPVDVRPKIFPMSNIPKLQTSVDSHEIWATLSDNTLPAKRKRHQSELYDSWRMGNSQSLDIPRKHDHQGKSKDKKATRIQPERRGALFFTQKALHHKDTDSPKYVSGRRQTRPIGLFSRQESVDSFHSRSSDHSENMDSPLLPTSGDTGPSLSSPPSSPGSNTMSPSTASKHQRRIPRLARSQTVDTSKLLDK